MLFAATDDRQVEVVEVAEFLFIRNSAVRLFWCSKDLNILGKVKEVLLVLPDCLTSSF